MRELLLMRHAEAAPRAIDGTDFGRPLTPSGRMAAARAGQRLLEQAPRPQLVLYSPASRTTETAELVAGKLDVQRTALKPEPKIYLATGTALARVVADFGAEHTCVLLIAHNPAISDLASALQPSAARSLATAEWRHISLAIDRWEALAP